MKVAATLSVLVLALAAASCKPSKKGASDQAATEATAEAPSKPGQKCEGKAPACLPEIDFTDINGQVFLPAQFAGKVVMFNFWATWCKPCLKEIPDLAKAHTKYKDKLVILGILNDDVGQEQIEKFTEQTGMNFPVIPFDDSIMSSFDYPRMLPTTFIYDRSGKLYERKQGAISEEELDLILKELL